MDHRIPFLDLRVGDDERKRLLEAIDRVLQHGRLVMGPEVERFEAQVAKRCGRKFAVGVGSGTDALFLALKAMGIGPGDEVITTSLSWIATANAIALCGASPVFADIGEDLNIDPQSVRSLVGKKTKAIVPVHYTGRCCQMQALEDIADAHGLAIVEDAAQAFGAMHDGRPAGSFGVAGCFSMNPMKVFAACGEAGAVVTDRQDIHERLLACRYNGTVNRETCIAVSLNGRIDTLQAAVLLERLKTVDEVIARRRQNAAFYNRNLYGVTGLPAVGPGDDHVYYTYTLQAQRRDELMGYLASEGIETRIQHPILMPHQPAYQKARRAPLPVAEAVIQKILCIPVNEKITTGQMEIVCDRIRRFFGR